MTLDKSKKSIYVATYNDHKLRELQKLTKDRYPLTSLKALKTKILWHESGKSFRQNALIKALSAYDQLKAPVLADDSGLCVPALNGEPGIYSSRYAGEEASDLDNNNKLLAMLKGLSKEKRKAYFYCSIVYLDEQKNPFFFSGLCLGKMIDVSKGLSGFGYDPLFVPDGYHETFAELGETLKQKISHRAKAANEWLRFMDEQES